MKRDMELIRKILFAIEDQYKPGTESMWGPKIDGYDLETIAEHCDLLHQQGLIKTYKPITGGGKVQSFRIGNLTTTGYEYLELIRNNDIWEKTKAEIESKNSPNTFEAIARIAGIFAGNFMNEMKG